MYGPERLRWTFPEKSYFDDGITVAAGSDVPVTPLNPWVGFLRRSPGGTHRAGKSITPEEGLTIMQALDPYTRNDAYLAFEENDKGSLEAGKLADYIVVDREILNTPSEVLKETKVLQTFVGGRLVYEASGR